MDALELTGFGGRVHAFCTTASRISDEVRITNIGKGVPVGARGWATIYLPVEVAAVVVADVVVASLSFAAGASGGVEVETIGELVAA